SPVEGVEDAGAAARGQVPRGFPDEDVDMGAGAHLGDAGAHLPGAHHADAGDPLRVGAVAGAAHLSWALREEGGLGWIRRRGPGRLVETAAAPGGVCVPYRVDPVGSTSGQWN